MGEHHLDTVGVCGSIPHVPTKTAGCDEHRPFNISVYSRAMNQNLVGMAVAALAACGGGGGSKPTVTCEIKDGLACEVRQSDDKAKYQVCWDFEAKCKNGSTFKKDHACATVNGSIVTQAHWDTDHVTITGDCDAKVSEEIKNITSEKQPDK